MNEHIYTVYRALNTRNGKAYVGFDSNWPERKRYHLWAAKKNYERHKNVAFYDAIRKYGEDVFVWEVLYQSSDRDHTLSVMEPHFIAENRAFGDGYNMTVGGEGTFGSKRGTAIEIDGIVYESMPIAAGALGISTSTIQWKLDDDHYPTWKRLSAVKKEKAAKASPIEIDGVRYETKADAARALGISRHILNNRLKAKKRWTTWIQL
jgi:hypothetical protein